MKKQISKISEEFKQFELKEKLNKIIGGKFILYDDGTTHDFDDNGKLIGPDCIDDMDICD